MNFHDNRGMYDAIAKWLEKYDVEIDWSEVMKCEWWVGPADWKPPPKWSIPKPFPQRLTPQMVTNLILAQESGGLQIPQWIVDPIEQQENVMLAAMGEGGVEPRVAGELTTGLSYWEKFLRQLAEVAVSKVELKLVSLEDRKALVRYAWIEEELRRREVEHNRERVMRQNRGEAKFELSRRGEEWLRKRAQLGNLACIEEMERKGYGSEEEHRKWRELNGKLVVNVAKARAAMKEKREVEGKEGKAEIKVGKVGPLDGIVGGEEEEEVTVKGAGQIMEVPKVEKREGIERELEIIRVGPNPRMLTCRYLELASERVCVVKVRDSGKFVRGMKFKMKEPVSEAAYREPWEYGGKIPRYRGRW